jgi:hypothetical protein
MPILDERGGGSDKVDGKGRNYSLNRDHVDHMCYKSESTPVVSPICTYI